MHCRLYFFITVARAHFNDAGEKKDEVWRI